MKNYYQEWQENHNITITVPCKTCHSIQKHIINLPCEYIDHIIQIALFGGISHWCYKTEAIQNSNYSDYELISKGGSLLLYVRGKKEVHILDLEKFLNGFCQAYVMNITHHWKEYKKRNVLNLSARLCDTIIQLSVFGKIRFKPNRRGDN